MKKQTLSQIKIILVMIYLWLFPGHEKKCRIISLAFLLGMMDKQLGEE